MRVVVTGATGNIGTSVLRALVADERVDSVVGVSRRPPGLVAAGLEWRQADVARDELEPLFAGADAVVHLAWQIQPSHRQRDLWRTNVHGSARVFAAANAAGVGALVHGSSVGVYSPGPKDERVDESWPRNGVRSSFYGRHKAEAEWRLDAVQAANPGLRVVRIRPGLVFKREAASGVRRLFAGPLLPTPLLRPSLLRCAHCQTSPACGCRACTPTTSRAATSRPSPVTCTAPSTSRPSRPSMPRPSPPRSAPGRFRFPLPPRAGSRR